MLLSIVTVTYNDREGLARTIRSLGELTSAAGDQVELIIVDGGVDPETLAAARSLRQVMLTVVSEPDRGIYDAMNKGLDRVTGRFVWFLNGGDECLATWAELQHLLIENVDALLLTDFELVSGDLSIVRSSRRARSIWHALPTSHQAILYPVSAVRSLRYDDRYRVAADYAFTASLYATGVRFVVAHVLTARFHLDGTSTVLSEQIRGEANTVQRTILGTSPVLRQISGLRHLASSRYRRYLSRSK